MSEKFVSAVIEHKPQVIGMSALLTTTMPSMSNTVKVLQEAGVRVQAKVMIGGAPITDGLAKQTGADGYSSDASSAVRTAQALIGTDGMTSNAGRTAWQPRHIWGRNGGFNASG